MPAMRLRQDSGDDGNRLPPTGGAKDMRAMSNQLLVSLFP